MESRTSFKPNIMNEHNYTKLTSPRYMGPQPGESINSPKSPQEYTIRSQAHRSSSCFVHSDEAILQKTMTDKGKNNNTIHHNKTFTTYAEESERRKDDLLSKNKGFGSFAATKNDMLKQPSRSPSPEKRVAMLRTLRTPYVSRKPPVRKSKDAITVRPQAAATAATQAWGTRGSFGTVDNECVNTTHNYKKSGNYSAKEPTRYRSRSATPAQGMEDINFLSSGTETSRKSFDTHQCEINIGKFHGDDDMNVFLDSYNSHSPGNYDPKITPKKKEIMNSYRNRGSNIQRRPLSVSTKNIGVQVSCSQPTKDYIPEKTCSGPDSTPYAARLTVSDYEKISIINC